QALTYFLQLAEGLDLPGKVVEADGGAAGRVGTGVGPHFEEAEVVVVVAVGHLQESSSRELGHDAEAEGLLVELDRAFDVLHVKHSVVQPLHRHWASFGCSNDRPTTILPRGDGAGPAAIHSGRPPRRRRAQSRG